MLRQSAITVVSPVREDKSVSSIIRCVAVLFSLMVCGCVATTAVMMNSSAKYPPTDSVEILFEVPKDRNCKMIGIIEGNGTQFNNSSDVLKKVQEKARKIGAHAVVPLTTDNQYVADSVVRNFDGSPLTIPGGNKITIKAAALRCN